MRAGAGCMRRAGLAGLEDRYVAYSARNTSCRDIISPFAGRSAINWLRDQPIWVGKKPLGDSSKDVRAKADLRFRKAERAATARDQAMNEYAAESERRRLKTAKLKELRLAKEAEEQAAAAAVPPVPKKKPVAKLSSSQASSRRRHRRRPGSSSMVDRRAGFKITNEASSLIADAAPERDEPNAGPPFRHRPVGPPPGPVWHAARHGGDVPHHGDLATRGTIRRNIVCATTKSATSA